jgi:hypothetical protein
LRDGEVWKKAGFLNNVSNATAEMNGIVFGGGPAFDEDLPLRRDEHAVYESEQGGFAAAATAEEDKSLTAWDGQ